MEDLGAEDPRWIGDYRLVRRLGAGGMGRVFLAHSSRGRTVAVKLVQTELAQQAEFRRRFKQEVRAAQRVGGAWTAPVLDADTEAATPWVATGYIAGPSLHAIVSESGRLPERTVRILAHGLTQALRDIHGAELVHRDLKPSNVLITIDGPRVIDFGIARALETVTDGILTRSGAVVGSPGFMSPEQVRGERVTPASDVFCLGSVLAYAATGRQPFGTADSGVHAVMYRIAQEEPDLEGLPEGLHELVTDCLKKAPDDRPSLDALLERTAGADDDGEPWLPGGLVAQLGRHAMQLLEVETPAGRGCPRAPPYRPRPGGGPRRPARGGPRRTAAARRAAVGHVVPPGSGGAPDAPATDHPAAPCGGAPGGRATAPGTVHSARGGCGGPGWGRRPRRRTVRRRRTDRRTRDAQRHTAAGRRPEHPGPGRRAAGRRGPGRLGPGRCAVVRRTTGSRTVGRPTTDRRTAPAGGHAPQRRARARRPASRHAPRRPGPGPVRAQRVGPRAMGRYAFARPTTGRRAAGRRGPGRLGPGRRAASCRAFGRPRARNARRAGRRLARSAGPAAGRGTRRGRRPARLRQPVRRRTRNSRRAAGRRAVARTRTGRGRAGRHTSGGRGTGRRDG
ncbi:serine/threonine-protein kinase [Streptomyces malaysiensis]|uniref:serine/threonine-protein kinase n=1 Tax=Streptomyces malaysiensis TaxID=92644 RepID=UPI0019D1F442|nr:serine/threonine-protein kinase [Streptomyces solisilvae]